MLRQRPNSSRIQRIANEKNAAGQKFDQTSITSAPDGQILGDYQAFPPAATGPSIVGGGNLSSKSFWNMEMLRQREEDAKMSSLETRRQSCPVPTLPQIQTGNKSIPRRSPPEMHPRTRSNDFEMSGRVQSQMEFRGRSRSNEIDKSARLSLLEKRHLLIEDANSILLSKHIQPGLGASTKPKQNKTLSGLYGVPPLQPSAAAQMRKRKSSLPPLRKSASEDVLM